MHFSMPSLAALSAVVLLSIAAPAFADEVKYSAALTGSAETPPTGSTGTGSVDATYDTASKTLTWSVTYQGLTGGVVAAHFHGPAAAGVKASPVVPIAAPYDAPINGSTTLTDQQAADLQAGLWYFNLHTPKFPDGEVRGQVVQTDASGMSAMAPASAQ